MNCKPGDLAYVVRADGEPENVGRVVTVVALDSHLTSFLGYPLWEVESPTPLTGVIYPSGEIVRTNWLVIADANLRPISGVPVFEDRCDEVVA